MVMSDSALNLADISASLYHVWYIWWEVPTYLLAALSKGDKWGKRSPEGRIDRSSLRSNLSRLCCCEDLSLAPFWELLLIVVVKY